MKCKKIVLHTFLGFACCFFDVCSSGSSSILILFGVSVRIMVDLFFEFFLLFVLGPAFGKGLTCSGVTIMNVSGQLLLVKTGVYTKSFSVRFLQLQLNVFVFQNEKKPPLISNVFTCSLLCIFL